MQKESLTSIVGGASVIVNTTLINTLVRGLSFAVDVGRTIGSSIRRIVDHEKC